MIDPKTYPQRPKNFYFKFQKLLWDYHAREDIGIDGCWLLFTVLMNENRRQWTGPARLWNTQLEGSIGKSIDQCDRIRKRCIEAGWLHYEPGTKSVEGKYWVTVPKRFLRMGAEECAEHPTNKKHVIRNSRRDASASRRRDRFSDEDQATAEYIWQRIKQAFPETRKPNLAKWSNDVRLMRERDERTHERIRQIFDLAHADEFWSRNILSPSKLRKQFDTLAAKASSNGHATNGKPARSRLVAPPPIMEMNSNGRP